MKQDLLENRDIDAVQLKQSIFSEQVRVFVMRKRILHIAGPFAGAYLVYLMSSHIAGSSLFVWWSLLLISDVLLITASNYYLNKEISHERQYYWYWGHILGLGVSGIIWGLSVVLFYIDDLQGQLYSAIMIVSVCSFSAVILIPSRVSYFIFFTCSLSPAFVFYLWLGDFGHVNLALGIVVLAINMIIFQSFATEHFLSSIEKNIQLQALSKSLDASLQRVKDMASRDYLTNLYNRRYGMDRLKEEHHRLKRYGSNLSIGIVDIDFFKKVNDVHGHNAGDKVLIEFSRCIELMLREEDTLFRYGGEEFLIVFPNTSAEAAKAVCERLRLAVENNPIEVDQVSINITASMGISEFIASDSIEFRVGEADKALYRAKELGRNKVEIQ